MTKSGISSREVTSIKKKTRNTCQGSWYFQLKLYIVEGRERPLQVCFTLSSVYFSSLTATTINFKELSL